MNGNTAGAKRTRDGLRGVNIVYSQRMSRVPMPSFMVRAKPSLMTVWYVLHAAIFYGDILKREPKCQDSLGLSSIIGLILVPRRLSLVVRRLVDAMVITISGFSS